MSADFSMAATDLAIALAQLETANPSDANRDGALSTEEVAAGLDRLWKFAGGFLELEFDGQPAQSTVSRLTLDNENNFNMLVSFHGGWTTNLRVRASFLTHLPADHSHFVSVQGVDGKSLGGRMLSPADHSWEIVTTEADGWTSRRGSTFTDFLKFGIEHIWTGYDHLAFLLALLLVCRDFKSAVQVITLFTLAHSVTLALATLELASVSGRVVEPVIAISVIYLGVENILRPENLKARWLITFLFGLIHGFGFATILHDMGVASSSTGVAMPLLAFNLGVEVGQVAVAALLLPVIWKMREWPPFVRFGLPATSGAVALAGVYWLSQRVAGGQV